MKFITISGSLTFNILVDSIFKERSSFYDSGLSFRPSDRPTVRPSDRPSVRPWENNASSSKTIRDNLTKFCMQV